MPRSASSARPASPAPSCCGSAAHPELELRGRHRRHAGRHPRRRPVPEPGRRLPRPRSSTPYDPRGRRARPRPRVLRPAPRHVAGARARPAQPGAATWSTWPPTSGSRTPRSTRRGTARSTPRPSCWPSARYGLPELFRDELVGATPSPRPAATRPPPRSPWRRWSAAGCIEPTGIVVDAASGVSGAGRPPKPNTTFCTVDEDFTAYGLLDHRHTPEIEQTDPRRRPPCRCCSRPTWPR